MAPSRVSAAGLVAVAGGLVAASTSFVAPTPQARMQLTHNVAPQVSAATTPMQAAETDGPSPSGQIAAGACLGALALVAVSSGRRSQRKQRGSSSSATTAHAFGIKTLKKIFTKDKKGGVDAAAEETAAAIFEAAAAVKVAKVDATPKDEVQPIVQELKTEPELTATASAIKSKAPKEEAETKQVALKKNDWELYDLFVNFTNQIENSWASKEGQVRDVDESLTEKLNSITDKINEQWLARETV